MKKIGFVTFILLSIDIFSQENQYFSNTGSVSFDINDYNFNIILVSNLAEALQKWNNPDEHGYSYIISISAVKIDEPIAILILFTSKKDIVNLTYNFSILKPDGTFSEKKYNGLIIYNGMVRKNIALHGIDLLEITYRTDDQIGKYQYHLDIYDSANYLGKAMLEFDVGIR